MSQLVLLRHGESLWNLANRFTGWVDIPLSQKGIDEAFLAGDELSDCVFDMVFTSTLSRAIQTALLALSKNKAAKVPLLIQKGGLLEDWAEVYDTQALNETLPVYMSSALNERMYGKLQGLNKAAVRKEYGEEKFKKWRRSFKDAPPDGESLEDTKNRVLPYFKQRILPELEKGKNVFISAHGNSLRSLVMYLDKLSEEDVLELEIPTGKPLHYQF